MEIHMPHHPPLGTEVMHDSRDRVTRPYVVQQKDRIRSTIAQNAVIEHKHGTCTGCHYVGNQPIVRLRSVIQHGRDVRDTHRIP